MEILVDTKEPFREREAAPTIAGVNEAPPAETPFYRSPAVRGTAWGIASALGYAATNILLRQLADTTDPVLITAMKAVPTLGLSCGLIGFDLATDRYARPTRRALAIVILASVFVQFAGNLALQGAFGLIGLALTVPISFGVLITASALMGRAWLNEPVTPRSLLSMALLVVSILILTFGAEETRTELPLEAEQTSQTWWVALGIALACVSGIGYALIAVVIRYVTREISVALVLFLVSLTGLLTLGAMAVARLGLSGLSEISGQEWAYMLTAGSFNAGGFYALGKSLKLISVVHANVLNASQLAIAAISGVLLFNEPNSWMLIAGVTLTIVGLGVIRDEAPAETA